MHLALSTPPLNVLHHQKKKENKAIVWTLKLCLWSRITKKTTFPTVELFKNTLIFDVCTFINVCESIINAKENTLEVDVQSYVY